VEALIVPEHVMAGTVRPLDVSIVVPPTAYPVDVLILPDTSRGKAGFVVVVHTPTFPATESDVSVPTDVKELFVILLPSVVAVNTSTAPI
jgi:hypothetical protein